MYNKQSGAKGPRGYLLCSDTMDREQTRQEKKQEKTKGVADEVRVHAQEMVYEDFFVDFGFVFSFSSVPSLKPFLISFID